MSAETTTERPLLILQEAIDGLPEDVRLSVELHAVMTLRPVLDLLTACESPIEQVMALALRGSLRRRFEFRGGYRIEPQFPLALMSRVMGFPWSGPGYRADFWCEGRVDGRRASVLVECDGFPFHSSKAQVKSDNERQRALQMAGFEVLRFSGTEIMASRGVLCAEQVGEFLLRRIEVTR